MTLEETNLLGERRDKARMTLGSLFDGSGGFPLAGALHGIAPLWASEIEPYPLKVTAARFPSMTQLGDVRDIDGALAPPVDIVTFGSPCQDLSVAGKQAGIHEGKRSSLFFEAVRIIREMRRATNGKYPRFAVWENVPGAFSSNKGEDFRAVLQAFCEVCGDDVVIPEPPKGKWKNAGCVVGDGFSVAWRVYDAQYWGVPQRRKRIYLVADFGSERAGEILFEPESVRGDPAPGAEARERTAADAERSDGGSRDNGLTIFHMQQNPISSDKVSPCIGGQGQATVGVFMAGQGARAGGIGYSETSAPTLRGAQSGSMLAPTVAYAAGFNDALGDARSTVYAIEGNVVDRVSAKNGKGWCEGALPTLNTQDRHAVVCIGNGQMNELNLGNRTGALNCMHDQQAVVYSGRPPRKYIVRRLMPLECCRLMGFPDWWEDGVDGSDSARYRMWGNGLALPCAADVMGRIVRAAEKRG